jgi:hypothetical protein
MEASPVELDPDLVELLQEMGRPPREAARQLIVLGLDAQGEISSGSAAQLLGISRTNSSSTRRSAVFRTSR